MTDSEQYYSETNQKRIRQSVFELKAEMGMVGKCMRLRSLYDRLIDVELELNDRYKAYAESLAECGIFLERAIIAYPIGILKQEVRKIQAEIRTIVCAEEKNGITPEMIAVAKESPLENLLKTKKNMALCVNHADKTPSMSIKNNFAYCFSCGYHGDSIDVWMKINNTSFAEAVRFLAGH